MAEEMGTKEIDKEMLSLAGEFAVASELCRRGNYAQLTLGMRKRTDLLVETDKAMLRIQVKTKQIGWWICRGIFGENIALVLVDYENKVPDQRPDFYVLTPSDWEKFVKSGWVAESTAEGRIKLDAENCPIWSKWKQPFKGVQVVVGDVSEHKEQWDKIETLLHKKE